MPKVNIYTDGACSGNPGVGGWAAILIYNKKIKEISGVEALTTNNKMELYAVIAGLKALKTKCDVDLYSDSAYVVNAFNQGWLKTWMSNSWRTSGKKEVQNVDLWKELLHLTEMHNVKFIKVKGHADNLYNNRCDKIATDKIKQFKASGLIQMSI